MSSPKNQLDALVQRFATDLADSYAHSCKTTVYITSYDGLSDDARKDAAKHGHTPVTIVPENLTYGDGGTPTPTGSAKSAVVTEANNSTTEQNVEVSFSCTVEESATWTVEAAVTLGAELTLSADYKIASGSATLSASVTLTASASTTTSTSSTWEVVQAITVPPQSTVNACMVVNEGILNIPWTATARLDGWVEIWFDEACIPASALGDPTKHHKHNLWGFTIGRVIQMALAAGWEEANGLEVVGHGGRATYKGTMEYRGGVDVHVEVDEQTGPTQGQKVSLPVDIHSVVVVPQS